MTADDFIKSALEHGQSVEIRELSANERFVFLISEAEVYCDMEGIDSLIDRYARSDLLECAAAFAEVGACEIAFQLRRIIDSLPTPEEDAMDRTNELIRTRAGYDYDAIVKAVEARQGV